MTPHEAMHFLAGVAAICRRPSTAPPADAELAALRFSECAGVIDRLLNRLVDQARTMEVIEAALEGPTGWPLLDDEEDPGMGL